MSESEKQAIVEADEPTAVDERQQTAGPSARPACSVEPAGLGRDDRKEEEASQGESSGNGNDEARSGKPAGLCHHVMESGLCCQSPALRGRRFCYGHLRLWGQRVRIARAIARRAPYRLMLPAMEDFASVRVAAAQVADALAAGLIEPARAGRLVYTFQQIFCALRWEAILRMRASSWMDPTLSPNNGDKEPALSLSKGGAPADERLLRTGRGRGAPHDGVGEQKRLIEEYPEFEAEFGLPAGIDVSQPAQLLFPPPEDSWRVPTPARDPKTSPWVHRQPGKVWTKDDIELEALDKNRTNWNSDWKQRQACNQRISRRERKVQEAAWQAEADRRNAAEDDKERQYASMDEGERSAYHLGVVRGLQAAQERAGEEEARKQPQKAVVSG